MKPPNRVGIPTSLPAKVAYFMLVVLLGLVYVVVHDNRIDVLMLALDLGLIAAILGLIMYPLFSAKL